MLVRVANAISRAFKDFNPLIFSCKILWCFVFFTRAHAISRFTRKFFLTQARAHEKAPLNFFTKSFLCLRLVDARFCQFQFQEAKKQVFPALGIFKDITKVNIYVTFLKVSKRFVILSFKTDFIADCILRSRFCTLDEVKVTHDIVYRCLKILSFYLSFLLLSKRMKCVHFPGYNVRVFVFSREIWSWFWAALKIYRAILP